MTSEEIVRGLKIALSKGESLRQAMISFHNAGYKKEEIERAARILQTHRDPNAIPSRETQQKESKISLQQKSLQRVSEYSSPNQTTSQTTKLPKKVSDYSNIKKSNPKRKILTILFISLAALFLLFALGIFLFSDEMATFFNRFF